VVVSVSSMTGTYQSPLGYPVASKLTTLSSPNTNFRGPASGCLTVPTVVLHGQCPLDQPKPCNPRPPLFRESCLGRAIPPSSGGRVPTCGHRVVRPGDHLPTPTACPVVQAQTGKWPLSFAAMMPVISHNCITSRPARNSFLYRILPIPCVDHAIADESSPVSS